MGCMEEADDLFGDLGDDGAELGDKMQIIQKLLSGGLTWKQSS